MGGGFWCFGGIHECIKRRVVLVRACRANRPPRCNNNLDSCSACLRWGTGGDGRSCELQRKRLNSWRGKNGPRGARRGHHRKRVGLSGRESEGSSGQEIGWSASFFYTAENTRENKEAACVFQRDRTSPRAIKPTISAAYLLLGKARFVMCSVTDWTEGTLQTRRGRNYDLSAAVQDVAPEIKTPKFPKQGQSGSGAGQR